MPHINVFIPMELDKDEEQKFVSKLGELITLIPGKVEEGLMVSFNSGKPLYHGGISRKKAVYMEVKIFKDCSVESKKQFVIETMKMLATDLNVPKEHVYINFFEVFNWAAHGLLLDL